MRMMSDIWEKGMDFEWRRCQLYGFTVDNNCNDLFVILRCHSCHNRKITDTFWQLERLSRQNVSDHYPLISTDNCLLTIKHTYIQVLSQQVIKHMLSFRIESRTSNAQSSGTMINSNSINRNELVFPSGFELIQAEFPRIILVQVLEESHGGVPRSPLTLLLLDHWSLLDHFLLLLDHLSHGLLLHYLLLDGQLFLRFAYRSIGSLARCFSLELNLIVILVQESGHSESGCCSLLKEGMWMKK